MPAQRVYRWDYIAPAGSADVFIHGYSNKEAVTYSAVVWGGYARDVPYPLGHIIMTQADTYRHVDGSVARKVYVKNAASFNPCSVDLLSISESL
jgi:hypothetical protein